MALVNLESQLEKIVSLEDKEEILAENEERWVIFPIAYDQIWECFKRTESHFWTAEDVNLASLKEVLQSLPQKDQKLIEAIAGYNHLSNGAIYSDSLSATSTMLIKTTVPEARAYHGLQIMKEIIHKELAISISKENFFNTYFSNSSLPFSIQLLTHSIVKRLFTATNNALIHSISLSSPLSLPGVHHGICELLARDEWLDSFFAALLSHHLSEGVKLDSEVIGQIVQEAVAIEEEYLEDLMKWAEEREERGEREEREKLVRDYIAYVSSSVLSQHQNLALSPIPCPIEILGDEYLQKCTALDEAQSSKKKKTTKMDACGVPAGTASSGVVCHVRSNETAVPAEPVSFAKFSVDEDF